MLQGRRSTLLGALLIGIGVLTVGWGCSSKQVTSGSGDQSTTTKKGKGEAQTVLQEPIVSIPTASPGAGVPEPDTRPGLVTPSTPGGGSVPNQGSAPPPPAASAITPASSSPDLKSPGDIFFDFDQYEVPRDAIPVLESNALLVRDNPGQSFLIEGHCDERGTLAYNLVLGEKRAKAAKRYLEGLGISASRIQTTSYGEVKPFCKEHNEGCWKYNRRAHFVIQ